MNNLEKIVLKASSLKRKVMSYIYDQMFVNIPTFNSKTFWREDFGSHLDDVMWWNIINERKENYNKIIHRLHETPAIHCKYDPKCSLLCLKCKNSLGTYSHLMWSCTKIAIFWLSVQNEMKKIFGIEIPLNPHDFILGSDISYECKHKN